jgi:type IV secretory pathway VirD2 relaxase
MFTVTDVHGIHSEDLNVNNPKYVFTSESEMDDFQSRIRERKLWGTFVAERVMTDNHLRSTGQYVKIWQDESYDQRVTLTFFVNVPSPRHHLEFDIADFASISARRHDRRTVRFKVNEDKLKILGFEHMDIRFKFGTGKLRLEMLSF